MGFAKTWKRWLEGRSTSDSNSLPRRQSRFQTDAEVRNYVDEQLTNGLPSDWSYHRDRHSLQWRIEPRVRKTNSLDDDYVLEVSGDYRLFILYYGNSSSGCGGISHGLWTAMVIGSERLSDYSLAEAVTHLINNIDHFPLNMWSLT